MSHYRLEWRSTGTTGGLSLPQIDQTLNFQTGIAS